MRALSLSLLSLTLLTSAAFAHENCNTPTAGVQLSTEQIRNLEGSYRLADGRVLQLTSLDDRLYANVKKQRRVALVAVEPTKLVSVDGAMSITYDLADPVKSLKLNN